MGIIGYGSKNPFFGRHHSIETKEKLSKKHLGKHYSRRTEWVKGDKGLMGNRFAAGVIAHNRGERLSIVNVLMKVLKKQKSIKTNFDLSLFGYRSMIRTKDGRTIQYLRQKRIYNPISFPIDVPFDWHHINETDVVAVSRKIHRCFPHSLDKGNAKQLEGVLG